MSVHHLTGLAFGLVTMAFALACADAGRTGVDAEFDSDASAGASHDAGDVGPLDGSSDAGGAGGSNTGGVGPGGSSGSGGAVPEPGSPLFPVYDAIPYSPGKPDLIHDHGWYPIVVVNEQQFWPEGVTDHSEPDEVTVKNVAVRLSRQHLAVIDIEAWPLLVSDAVPLQQVQANIEKHIKVVRWMKEANPNLQVGYYGELPIRNYWAPVRYASAPDDPQAKADYEAWQEANARAGEIAQYVDAVFPSLYTFYDDQEGWVVYAQENIEAARAYGKPVFPFLWPRYHGGDDTYLPADYWQMQLSTLAPIADGVVIWDKSKSAWDPTAPWWAPTLEFVASQQALPRASQRHTLHDRVVTSADVTVLAAASPEALLLGTEPPGSHGTILAGPIGASGRAWWEVKFDWGLRGWCAEERLESPSGGLVAQWLFAEGAGDWALDSTGRGNTARLEGAPDWSSGSVVLDGTSDYLSAGAIGDFNFGSGDFTLSAWVKMTGSGGVTQVFLSKNLAGTCCRADGYPGYYLGSSGGRLVMRTEDAADGLHTIITPGTDAAPYADVWTHVVGMRRSNALLVFVNGALSATSETLGPDYSVDNPYPLAIGATMYWSVANFFAGSLRDVRVYNRSLTDLDVLALYQAAPVSDVTPPSSPLGVTATSLSSTQVALSWAASTDDAGVIGYRVLRDGEAVAVVVHSPYTDPVLEPVSHHVYEVQAYDARGNHSATSSPAAVTLPGW